MVRFNTSRRYFHTFDALRFFSFLLVFFQHLPGSGFRIVDFFQKSGEVGVSFFFVLSGFLITYILLYEKTTKEKIKLKNFFIRRILRIWPLFYVMILFAFISPFILQYLNLPHSNEGYAPNWFASIFFGENYKMMIEGTFPDGAPLRIMWTLCVEEHFYIIWGLALYFLPTRKVPNLIVLSIIIANITRVIYLNLHIPMLDIFSNIDYFAYGAIPAYLIIFKPKAMEYINTISLYVKYLSLIFTVAIMFTLPNYPSSLTTLLSPTIMSVFFVVIILFTLTPRSIYIKDSNIMSKLGVFTYGLYLYHTIVIIFIMQVLKKLPFDLNWLTLAIISLVITVLISIVSYHLFEKQFLKLKKYFYR